MSRPGCAFLAQALDYGFHRSRCLLMSGDRYGGGAGRNPDASSRPRQAGRSRSPRPGLAAESHDPRPPVTMQGHSATGPTPAEEGAQPRHALGSAAAALGQPMAHPPVAAPPGPASALSYVRAPAWQAAPPGGLATAAALSQQLPLHQAAVAASQAARAAAAALPSRPSPTTSVTPSGASLAILEAQVASLGALLLALQGIVLQRIAVVNLMRSGS